MARTIEQIKTEITDRLKQSLPLSTSAAAEWRMWTHAVAYAIYCFEVILDLFRAEMDNRVSEVVPGTLEWYAQQCYRYQHGHELKFDPRTAALYYELDDPEARVVKVAAVTAIDRKLIVRAASVDETETVVPLTEEQLLGFKSYLNEVKFAGTLVSTLSTWPDDVRYKLKVWYSPLFPADVVRQNLLAALTAFKQGQWFGGKLYESDLVSAATKVEGVITAKLLSLEVKGATAIEWTTVDVRADLYAGYFNFTQDSTIELININDLE